MSSGPILIEIEDQAARSAIDTLLRRVEHPAGLMAQIGEAMVDSTYRRFSEAISPSGTPWAPNKRSTVMRYLEARYGEGGRAFSKRRRGVLTKFGENAAAGKKPLIGETKRLSSEIFYETGPGEVRIGSGLKYAAAQQFGMAKGYAGTTKRGSPIPWGDIPARPFLGLSEADRRTVIGLIEDWLTRE